MIYLIQPWEPEWDVGTIQVFLGIHIINGKTFKFSRVAEKDVVKENKI